MQLVDFESWKTIQSKVEKDSSLIINGGSFHGIVDSIERRHMDVQGNIFAFGVLMLELISGRLPNSKDRGDLVDWVSNSLAYFTKILQTIDIDLITFSNTSKPFFFFFLFLFLCSLSRNSFDLLRPEDLITLLTFPPPVYQGTHGYIQTHYNINIGKVVGLMAVKATNRKTAGKIKFFYYIL